MPRTQFLPSTVSARISRRSHFGSRCFVVQPGIPDPHRSRRLNPDEALEAARARVSRRGSIGSLGRARFRRSPNIAGGFETGTAFSTGAANQRTDQEHGRAHREVNKQAPSFGEGGAIVGECHSLSGTVGRVGFVKPTTSISSNRMGRPSRRVESKICRCASGTRCTSVRGRCTVVEPDSIQQDPALASGIFSSHILTKICKSGWGTDTKTQEGLELVDAGSRGVTDDPATVHNALQWPVL